MWQILLVGVWGCAVALGGAYGGVYWRMHPKAENAGSGEHAEAVQVKPVKPITVPVIVDGVIKGYVSAEFNLVSAKADAHGGETDPESFFMDEAFRLIYAETKMDFAHIEKADLAALTSQLTANINQRMGKRVVRETLVKNFVFIARDQLPR